MRDFLGLLLDGAPLSAYDELVASAPAELRESRLAERTKALRLRDQIEEQRRREAELAALYETANDLTAIRDLDEILAAIVRRARQLLRADMTYLSLNDEGEGASYMKVTDGALTPEFARLRLPLGTGLLGLVAQSGEPYFTEDYQNDPRFVHRGYIDEAVAGEQIRAILGVPLTVDGVVIGALLAVHRTVRRFPATEVSLLTSFAAHAAVALQNARLFERTHRAVAALDEANRELTVHARATERAAQAHDLLTDVVIQRGGVAGVREVLGEVLGGQVSVLDPHGEVMAGPPIGSPDNLEAAMGDAQASGRSVVLDADPPARLAVAVAGDEHLATLIHAAEAPLGEAETRTFERGALVIALVLLFARVEAEAEDRVRGELLGDLLLGRDRDADRLRERAGRQGLQLGGELEVSVASVAPEDLHRVGRLAMTVARERGGVGGEHDGRAVMVTPEPAAHLLVDLAGNAVCVGLASADSLDDVVTAHGEASRTAGALRALGRTGEASSPAGLGIARFLLRPDDSATVAEFVQATLGPLLSYDAARGSELVDTVEVWLAHEGSVAAAARALHVHPNTVSQRLSRIGELLGGRGELGPDWREASRLLDLRIALQWRRMCGHSTVK